MSEFELIRRIQERLPARSPGIVLGSGDDCALLDPEGRRVLVTTDAVVEGVHFEPGARPEDVGYKAVATNLSDVAAMGGQPWAMVATYGLPAGLPADHGDRLLSGMLEAAAPHGVALVGGDIVASRVLWVSVTLLGQDVLGRVVTRAGARPGDLLLVTGELGGSILGRHLRPVARVAEGLALNRDWRPTAMIDLSDGLAGDLRHVCRLSGVGAEIEARSLPVSAAAKELARRTGRAPWEHALTDGEDYELLFAIAPAEAEALVARPPFETPLTRVGRVLPREAGIVLVRPDGSRGPLDLAGYEHAVGRDSPP